MLSPISPEEYRQAAKEDDPLTIRRIRALNDVMRLTGHGGVVVESLNVSDLPDVTKAKVHRAIQEFDDFTEENDPWGEHDCAVVRVGAEDYLFKVDYYDKNLEYHSPDKADPLVTTRVLTICTPDER